jgi:hypothetical protein
MCIGGVCNFANQTTTVMPVTTTMNMNMTTNSTAGWKGIIWLYLTYLIKFIYLTFNPKA